MPHVVGTALSMAALLTALRNACTANGWTLSGNVLHKGTCFAEAYVGNIIATGAPANGYLFLRSGNGIDVANALTDPAPLRANIGILKAATGSTFPDWDWPVEYSIHVHTDPDEVFMVVNYGAGEYFQWLAFGQSGSSGNAGTGNWHFASVRETVGTTQTPTVRSCVISPGGANAVWNSDFCPAPFLISGMGTSGQQNAFIHGAIHSVSGLAIWTSSLHAFDSGSSEGRVSALRSITPLLSYSPNAWNNEAVLLPVQIIQNRPELKSSLIGELQHVRLLRNDYIDPGTVIELGPDRWKVYPCYRKNAAVRDGISTGFNGGIDHSGTLAVAIRYDGP